MTFSQLATFKIQNFWPISLKHHSWEQGFTAVHYGTGTYLYSGQPRAGSETGKWKFSVPPRKGGNVEFKSKGKKIRGSQQDGGWPQLPSIRHTTKYIWYYWEIHKCSGTSFRTVGPCHLYLFLRGPCSRQCHFQFAVVTISSSCRQDGGKNWQTLSDLGAKI